MPAAAAARPVRIPPPPSGPAPVIQISNVRTAIRLIVLRGAVAEGTAYDLNQGMQAMGRQGELAFPGDALMAARHVVFQRIGDAADVVEVPGPTGCFRRIRQPEVVESGAVIFAGEQYLLARRGDDVPADAVEGEDLPPEVFGTPLPVPHLHITQLLLGGLPGRVVSTDRDVLTVGREGCDLSFPQDRFLSGRHLRFELLSDGTIQIVDIGSLNGTFVRCENLPYRIEKGDELLVGEMLFRVDIREE